MSRDQLHVVLAENGIGARTFFIPMHCQPVYWEAFESSATPVAEQLCRDGNTCRPPRRCR
ncbi:MAG: DegT/DnrJ/EryC1/StrS family aminotransferase [Caldilineaceae bacterium]